MSKNGRDADAGPSIRSAEMELADQVTRKLSSALLVLSPLERAVLVLHNGFGFGPAEVANILGIEESRVARMVEELRARLRAMGPLASKNPGHADEDPGDDSPLPS